MNQVAPDLQGVISADGAGGGVHGVRSSHGAAHHFDRFRPFQGHHHHRRPRDPPGAALGVGGYENTPPLSLKKYKKELDKLQAKDLIYLNKNTVSLTKKGIDFANIVWREFI